MILPSKYVRNIGVMFYSVLNFERYITDICKSCYFNIRKTHRIKKRSTEHRKILANAFKKLQNCAARLIVGCLKDDLIRPLLRELHWLPVEHRVTFKFIFVSS